MTPFFDNACPINEQTADGHAVGRCWFALVDVKCPRHGNVSVELQHYIETDGKLTLENDMRRRKGLPLLGKDKT